MLKNGYEYVDLGLPSGTMWATCNVGADKPEDYGLLFQFGRVDGYKFGDKNNKFRTKDQNKQDTGNEYTPVTTSGKVYKKYDISDVNDDAAHVNMGGKWRMPTYYQLEELLNNTSHKIETLNDVKGMMFTSKINNNQLFIPFAGYWYNGIYYNAKSCTDIWSSQVHALYVDNAYSLYCNSNDYTHVTHVYGNGFSSAFSVRGVFNINEHKDNVEHTNNDEHTNNINMLI